MRRLATPRTHPHGGKAILASLVLVLAVTIVGETAQQLRLRAAASAVEERLERGGGSAEISVSTTPALQRLFGRSGSIEVTGHDLKPASGTGLLDELDDAKEVHVLLRDFLSEPVSVKRLQLSRERGEPSYRVALSGTTTKRRILAFIEQEAGPAAGTFTGPAARRLRNVGLDERLSVRARLRFESENGIDRFVPGGSTVCSRVRRRPCQEITFGGDSAGEVIGGATVDELLGILSEPRAGRS